MDVEDKSSHVFLLLNVHPGHGFIKEKQFRFESQSTTELHPFTKSVWQRTNNGLANVLHLQEIDDLLHYDPMLDFLFLRTPEVESSGNHAVVHVHVPGRHEIVQHTHPGVEGNVLKGTGNT